MKTKLILSILLLGALLKSNAQNVLPVMKLRPADYEYLSSPDSLGIRHQILMPNIMNKTTNAIPKLPYPIIFIHGLDSGAHVWGNLGDTNDMTDVLTSYGLSFGGRFDFNLNDDNNNLTSNKIIYPDPGSDIAQYSTTIVNGDFYFLNFAVGSDGSYNPSNLSSLNVLSNEASIAKQGVALSRAIQQVMNTTGRDKVILFGHSMGGLCAREYLQNPENWTEPSIKHHVAKLITTGTPHGGYTGANFLITGINSSSEAYRDLRTEYSNNNSGAFLFGGIESSNYIGTSYYNNDINCNGINNDNSTILGLNQKNLYTDVDYAYIMGNCTNCVISQGTILGDGVVRLVNANLSNFYNLPSPKNEFIYTASAITEIHSDLPKAIAVNMQALDEPNQLWLAYGVEYDLTYKGFIYNQPENGYLNDYDDYKFTVTDNSIVNIIINNITSSTLSARIFDINGTLIGNTYSGNLSNPINISQLLSTGDYYLEIYGTPIDISVIKSYNFNLSSTLTSNSFELEEFLVHPNPTTSKVYFDNSNSNFKEVSIYNYLGQEVAKTSFTTSIQNQEIDMSTLAIGVYVLKFSDDAKSKSVKVIKQ
ncbi:MAG: alpha/beta fold hydrolase [Flavobacterium sp.]|nr:alpha/beta fold hydrolase [Flavobacterium sp.]